MAGAEYDVTFGIKADAKQAKKEIKDIVLQAQSVAKDIQAALEATKGSKKGTQLRQLRDDMGVTAKEVKAATDAFSLYQAVLGQTAAAEKKLSDIRNDKTRKNLKKSLSRYTNKRAQLDASNPKDAAKIEKYDTKIAEIQQQLEPSEKEIERLTTKIGKLKERASSLKEPAKQFVDTYGAAGAKAQEILNIVNKTATSTGDLSGKANKLNEGFDKAKSSASGAKDALDGLTTKENKANEAKAKTAAANAKEDTSIKGLIDTLGKYQAQLERAKKSGQDTVEIEEKIATTTEKLNNKFKFSSASENIADVTRRLLEMQQAKRELEGAGIPKQFAGQYTQIVAEIERLKQSIADYKKSLHATETAHETTAKSSNKLFSTLKKLPSIVGILKSGFRSLSKTANGVKSSFNSMARDMRSNFKHMLTSITKYVLGFRSLFFLVRRLRKYIGEGIQNLVLFNGGDNEVNRVITKLLSSLLYLKNAWAAAFSPVIIISEKWLPALIDRIADVGNAVARLIGSLTGQTVVFNAVKVRAQDYADTLDNTGGSASGAADKVKKLTDRLAAFDDLNVLGKDNDPDDTGSGGGGGASDIYTPDPNEMFTIVDAETNAFMEMLKKAWETADFSEVGKTIKDKLIEILPDEEDWKEIQEQAGKIGKGFGSFFAGLFGDPELFEAGGFTIAEALNTVTYAISAFLDETDGIDFGGNLAEGFNTFLNTTDWETAGANINGIITGIADNVKSFLDTVDKQTVVTKITEFMQGLNLKEIMISIKELAISATDVSLTVLGGLVWEAGQSFGDELIDWVQRDIPKAYKDENGVTVPIEIDMTPTTEYATNPVGALIERMVTEAGMRFVDRAIKIDVAFGWAPDEDTAFTNLTKNWNDFIDGFKKGWSDFWYGFTHPFEYFANNEDKVSEDLFGDTLFEDEFEDLGIYMSEGIFKGFKESMDNMVYASDWIGTNVFAPIWQGIKDAFGIESPSKEMAILGGYIGEGLFNGIDEWIPDIEQIFIDFKDWLSGKWDEVKGNTYEKWVGIKTNVTEKAEEIKDKAEEKFETLKTNLTNKWQEIKGAIYEKLVGIKINMKEVFEQMGEVIKAPINTIIDIIEGMVNRCIDGINSLTEGLATFTEKGSELASTFGIDIPSISPLSHITIPHLAQGAVIPPNKEFMAVLGDQSSGTNIEAPLDTIKQAMAEVLANNGNEEVIQLLQQLIAVVDSKNLTIGDKEIGKANARYVQSQNLRRGVSF